MRAAIRFLGAVLITSGVLCLVDVGITMLWQEPISGFVGGLGQNHLNEELARAAPSAEPAFSRRETERAADGYERELRAGRAFGKIVLPKPDRSFAVVEGVDLASLRKGPGHFDDPKSALPGQGKTVGIAGHRTTYLAPFRHNDRLRRGDEILMRMPYGTFTYEVQRVVVVPPERISVLDDVGYERLVLTACHPPLSAAERLIVFARLVRMEPANRGEPKP